MVKAIQIGKRLVGPGHPCFVIAEAGVNHGGSLEAALKLVEAAKRSGADAVKFQTFRADLLVTEEAPKADYQKTATGKTQSQYEMLKELELSKSDFRKIKKHADEKGIVFLSTPFDYDSLDFLDELNVPAFKVGSGELTNIPLIRKMASMKRPVILSTGMANLDEIAEAVHEFKASAHTPYILLHCVSNYPTEPQDVNLLAMKTMMREFDCPIGYSDHTLGITVALASVAYGACVLEKHLTLDRNAAGPDHKASLEPEELKNLVEGIRVLEQARGTGLKVPAKSEASIAAVARKSLIASKQIKKGHKLTEDFVEIKRPGTGIAPGRLRKILGKKAKRDISLGTLLKEEMFS